MSTNTGWLGIAGHGVGVREVPGSNPGGTTQFAYPNFRGETRTRNVRGLGLSKWSGIRIQCAKKVTVQ